jgi:hypothetical protein
MRKQIEIYHSSEGEFDIDSILEVFIEGKDTLLFFLQVVDE